MKRLVGVVAVALLSAPLPAQQLLPPRVTAEQLAARPSDWIGLVVVTNASAAGVCLTGGGAEATLCWCDATACVALEDAAAGSGDIAAVGDCATGACFQSETARHGLMAPSGGGVASFRALVEADISDLVHTTDTDNQDATEVPYTPTTGGDWADPDPASAGEGLDDLAARLTAAESGGSSATSIDADGDATEEVAVSASGVLFDSDDDGTTDWTLETDGDWLGPSVSASTAWEIRPDAVAPMHFQCGKGQTGGACGIARSGTYWFGCDGNTNACITSKGWAMGSNAAAMLRDVCLYRTAVNRYRIAAYCGSGAAPGSLEIDQVQYVPDSLGTCDSSIEGAIEYDSTLGEHCACNNPGGAGLDWRQLDGGGPC